MQSRGIMVFLRKTATVNSIKGDQPCQNYLNTYLGWFLVYGDFSCPYD